MIKIVKTILKLVVTGVIIYYIYSSLDINKFIGYLQNITITSYIGAFVVFNMSQIISAKRLELILLTKKVAISLKEQIKLYYLGMFYNLFLPAGIGGDGYKVYYFSKLFQIKIKTLIKLLLYDRFVGLSGLLFLLLIGLYFYFDYKIISSIFVLCVLLIGGVVLFFFKDLNGVFFQVLLISIVIQALQGLCGYLLFENLTQLYGVYLILFFISSLATVFPFTIGGLGAREAVFVFGLSNLDINYEAGVLFCGLFFSLTVLSSLFGVFFIKRFSIQNKF